MTHTWSYSEHLDGNAIEYAKIWSHGATLNQVCPQHLETEWKSVNEKAKSFLLSFQTAKINLKDNCLFDLLPEGFILEFYGLKNQITESVFTSYEKPKNYDFLLDLLKFIGEIKDRKLNLKFDNLDFTDKKIRNSVRKIKDSSPFIDYSPWNTATGRLSTLPGSFPILNLNKELRPVLQPNNDAFVEFDYNSAELRVLFALLGQKQPKNDVHSWIAENVFKNKYDRETTKKKVFAWLYNPKAKNKKLNQYLNRDKIYENFYRDGIVTTPYDRSISAPEEKAVNYAIQSTASDLLLSSAINISKILENRKSNIAFCVHDSLVIDMHGEDKYILNELVENFASTKFGSFKTNVSIGRNYGSMRKIK